jgi:hypothetical protein
MQHAEGRNKMKSAKDKSKQFNKFNQNKICTPACACDRPRRTLDKPIMDIK